ncbi:MAG: hypothetical protein Q8N99_07240 [Nanoarchaeota archaeon]|nr:hypothetical protein [Nanoarchaeota archaeon]
MDIKKELAKYIIDNNLSAFNLYKTPIKSDEESIFKTRDGKTVHNKVLSKISNNFCFSDSSNLLNFFDFNDDFEKIKERQGFFSTIPKGLKNDFLKELKKPRASWKPRYGIVAVTDNEETFKEMKNLDIPVKFLLNEDDVLDLQNYEIVEAVLIENFTIALEQLPQSVFIDSIDDVYLERYLERLSGWIENFRILELIEDDEIRSIVFELKPLLYLIDNVKKEKINRKELEDALDTVNEEISDRLKNMNISGSSLFEMLSKKKLPEEIEKIIDDSIKQSSLSYDILEIGIPVRIDEQELENHMKMQDTNENTDFAEKIKKSSAILKKVPEKLERLNELLLIYDFIAGISKFCLDKEFFPELSSEIRIVKAKNIFLDDPQEISFYLNELERCSILTGANSGGKTTLIEHLLQLITMFYIGLPVRGLVKMPIFSEVYYFAKNKGNANKGAFETLLSQMSKIKTGRQTLIVADEIESVTEPGVAGKIIAATCEYFIDRNCFLVIATHLGQEIIKVQPKNSRIDGISATGLDDNNELIVDHNPVFGKLANSTPELIVEKMARSGEHDYFIFLNEFLKKNRNSDFL